MAGKLLGRKSQNALTLIPGTVTAITPAVTVTTDGATTAIEVLVPKYYTPAVNDRVGLLKIGNNFLALSLG